MPYDWRIHNSCKSKSNPNFLKTKIFGTELLVNISTRIFKVQRMVAFRLFPKLLDQRFLCLTFTISTGATTIKPTSFLQLNSMSLIEYDSVLIWE